MSSKSLLAEIAKAASDLGMIPAVDINGRVFRNDRGEYIDYCTTNYLGFDFRPELQDKGAQLAKKWGSLTGWSRLEADPTIYSDLEKRIARFLNCPETILSHTITITNFSLIPTIAQKGLVVCDHKVHTVVWEACRLARDHGATVLRFKHQDVDDLERVLKENKNLHPKLVAVDGVYSISTEFAPVKRLQEVCERYGAWLYVDDAHGFGVLGENPTEKNPYGKSGRGIVAYAGGDYERTFYVTSFGKAFCTHTAFASVPKLYTEQLRERCMQYIFSAPMPPYVIGMVNASMDLNETEGDLARAELLHNTKTFVDSLRSLELNVSNHSYFPVVFWEIGHVSDLIKVAHSLFGQGVIAGIRAFPIVPENECGLRFGLTRLHTDEQIQKTIDVIKKISKSFVKKSA